MILVNNNVSDVKIGRAKAHTYGVLDLSDIPSGTGFELVPKDDALYGSPTEETLEDEQIEGEEEPVYAILTKEFGLYANIPSQIQVTFCDGDIMLVALISGAIVVRPEDSLLVATRGLDSVVQVKEDEVLWINKDKLLSYSQYWGELEGKYTQDFIYTFDIKGGNKNQIFSFSLKPVEVLDISGGFIDGIKEERETKERAKEVQKQMAMIQGYDSEQFSFDGDDDADYSFDDDDEDDYMEEGEDSIL